MSTVDSFFFRETKSFSFRVPIIYIKKYKELNEMQQELVREILKAAFIKALEQVSGVKLEQQRVINVVMPVQVNVNVAKAEASAEVDVLQQEIRILKKKLQLCREELKLSSNDSELKQLREKYESLLMKLRKLYFSSGDRIPKSLLWKIINETK